MSNTIHNIFHAMANNNLSYNSVLDFVAIGNKEKSSGLYNGSYIE